MDQPAWLAAAWAEFGVHEVAGGGNEPAVARYFREAGHGDVHDDAVPWCAAYLGAMLKRGGAAGTGSLLARSYLGWGDVLEQPKPGAVTVLSRGDDLGAGHVGFLVGATGDKVFLLGGNQSDAVCVQAFDAGRVLAYRWPAKAVETDEQRDIFDIALRHVLDMEGGYGDDPYDPGGPTNRGITLREFAAWQGVTWDATSRARLIDELKRIPDATVAAIYRQRYWLPARCAALPGAIALMHFDAAVNHGAGAAIRMLQQAAGVAIDGEIGPETLGAAHTRPVFETLERYAEIRRARYRAIPTFWRFGRGWLRRVDATLAAAIAVAGTNSLSTQGPLSTQSAKGQTHMPQDYGYPAPGEFPNQPVLGDAPTQASGKWWAHSKTVWGALITAATTVLPVLGPLIGFNLPVDVIKQLGDQSIVVVQALGGLFGTLLTIYGRSQAHLPLMRRDVKVRV